jgi:hypothetical protein
MASLGVQVVEVERRTLWEVCTRTQQATYLFRPEELVVRVCLGTMEKARRATGAAVHALSFQSNHYHMLMSVKGPEERARFFNIFNGELGGFINLLRGRYGSVWAETYSRMLVMPSKEAERAEYLAGQGLQEGLYARAEDNPCAQTLAAVCRGEATWGYTVNLRAWRAARRRDASVGPEAFLERVEVALAPLPHLAGLPEEAQQAAWRGYVASAEEKGRLARAGRPVLGSWAMRRMDPFGRPEEAKRSGRVPDMMGTPEECDPARAYRRAARSQRAEGMERLADALPAAGIPPCVHLPSALQAVVRRRGGRPPG